MFIHFIIKFNLRSLWSFWSVHISPRWGGNQIDKPCEKVARRIWRLSKPCTSSCSKTQRTTQLCKGQKCQGCRWQGKTWRWHTWQQSLKDSGKNKMFAQRQETSPTELYTILSVSLEIVFLEWSALWCKIMQPPESQWCK